MSYIPASLQNLKKPRIQAEFVIRHRHVYYGEPGVRPMGVGEALCACGKDGVEFPVEIGLSPVEIRGSAFVWMQSATSTIVNAPSLQAARR
jgi:hypothetical protein